MDQLSQTSDNSGDVNMTEAASSPPCIKTFTLVDEEALESLIGTFKEITGLHIYSLEPARMKVCNRLPLFDEIKPFDTGQDKAFLAATNSEYLVNHAPELNPQDHAQKYGIILNSVAQVIPHKILHDSSN